MAASYSMPVRIRFGEGVRSSLPELPCVKEAKCIALFIGSSSLKKSGHLAEILGMLKGKDTEVYEGISAEPTLEELSENLDVLRRKPADCVVAVGGGSVLDLAKAVALFAPQKSDAVLLLKTILKDAVPIPVVAIPTTAGTGSEVSPFAVFWDKTEKKKHSLMHAGLFPAEALVDPELTYSMPPAVTASAGMDAFTQACEAYWNRDHLPLSDDYALAAICRIRSALPKAVRNGDDKEARREMMLGSLEAGLAFSNTRTAACHSISYPMTAHFGVSHGQAVGITLPQVLILNAGTMPERAGRFLESMNSDSMDDAADKIRKMMVESGLKTRLSELKIKKEDIDLIVKEGFTPERMGNNPYVFNPESLKKLLLSIL